MCVYVRVYVYVYVCMCVCVCDQRGQKRTLNLLDLRVTGGGELPDIVPYFLKGSLTEPVG